MTGGGDVLDARTLRVLEFPKILERLAALAGSAPAKERALALEPSASRLAVERALAETTEARALLEAGEGLPTGGIRDLRAALARVRKGGSLDPEQFVAILDTLQAAARLRRFLTARRAQVPTLADVAEGLGGFPALTEAITAVIAPEGTVRDDASPALAALRQEQRRLLQRIRERLESMIRSPVLQPYLQDALVTTRQGRYVIPVRIEHRAQVPGVVHDQSASGATVFIEPMPVVTANNELRQLAAQEEEEVARLLAALSARVAQEADALGFCLESLVHLDVAAAKGRLSVEMRAVAPVICSQPGLTFRGARHPLLTGAVVPIDLSLGGAFHTVVITGPNTGGKTVSLKTMGLLAAMTQAGLHVPAAEASQSVFPEIFCDSGDEQSIAQNLSTFSSHMANIVRILQAVTPGALVLLDELGAGTDPAEGAALAMALLEAFHLRGALTAATTHYSELKTYAWRRAGVQNASVEFDVETLQPTFRLLLGVPGKSNAFEIAQRLGLPEKVSEAARALMTRGQRDVTEAITALTEERERLEELRREQERLRAEAAGDAERLREQVAASEAERARLLAEASEEARRLVERARCEVDALLRELRAQSEQLRQLAQVAMERQLGHEALQQADAAAAMARRVKAELAGREASLEQATKTLREKARRRKRGKLEAVAPSEGGTPLTGILRPGQTVYVRSLRQQGTVLQGGEEEGGVLVQVGIMKLTVPRADIEEVPQRPGSGRVQLSVSRAATVPGSLDLHGLTVDEALAKVDRYLDDALLAGMTEVRLVHGKGTGALREAIGRYLATHRLVASHRRGEAHEGGVGATVVRLIGRATP